MGRELKRVPLDFDWPIGKIWDGYLPEKSKKKVPAWKGWKIKDSVCTECENLGYECSEDASYCLYYPENRSIWEYDPPSGDGYQLWETTSEGSPKSPVFESLDELCAWCEENATTFASFKTSKEKWKEMLLKDNVHHRDGNMIFI